jgi:8-oxo-dGTP pyrophosphatase MutT (NUDIX family)
VKPRFDIPCIQRVLTERATPLLTLDAPKLAAVAAIVRPAGDESEVLFIRRAEHEHDPWSGHMAFPGGRAEPHDASLLETATRETSEEIGLDLSAHGELLGRVDDVPAIARGKPVGLVIRPYVFALRSHDPPLKLNREVEEVVWGPLGAMARGELDTTLPYRRPGHDDLIMPGYAVEERIVWGLTHRMLINLFDLLREG